MPYKIKIMLLLLIGCIVSCIFSGSSVTAEASNSVDEYLVRGFSGGFFLVKNSSDTSSCTCIKENGDSILIFSQRNAKIIKAAVSDSYLYLFIEDKSSSDPMMGIFTYDKGGLLKSTSGVEADNTPASAFAADDIYFYYLESNNGKIHKISHDRRPYETVTLQKGITNLFSYNGNVYALSKDSIINVNNADEILSSDIPNFSSSDVIEFYDNICIDDSGKVYSFNEGYGFKYIKTLNYKISFVLSKSYCGVSKNVIYSLSEAGTSIGKYTCDSDIEDACVSGNKAAILCSGEVKIISLKDFAAFNSNTPGSNSGLSSDKNNKITDIENKYQVIDKYVIMSEGTTVAAIKKNIGTSLTFCNDDGKAVTSGKVGTGFRIEYRNNSSVLKKYTIIIKGDLTGEGSVNTRDSKALTDYLLENNDFNETKRFAADLDNNEKIDSIDLLLLIRKYK